MGHNTTSPIVNCFQLRTQGNIKPKKKVTRRLALDFEPLLSEFSTFIYYLLIINYNKSHNALDYN